MSYPAQADLLAQYVKKNFAGQEGRRDHHQHAELRRRRQRLGQGRQDAGPQLLQDACGTPKGNNSWITTYASEMKSAGVAVLFILSAPVDYIQFAQQSGTQGFKPQYVGVGISKGLNAVLGAGCPDVDGGIFFSPFPGLDWARQNLPEFFLPVQSSGKKTDDIALALWGLASVTHEAFKRYEQAYKSTDLTREDFVKMLENTAGIATKVNPHAVVHADGSLRRQASARAQSRLRVR